MVHATGAAAREVDEPDLVALAAVHQGLQDFDRFSEAISREHGCTASMYQLLLAVHTVRRGGGLDIGRVATALRIRHPSAAEMVRKAEDRGFVRFSADPDDGRRVLIDLTDAGRKTVTALAQAHARELRRLRGAFISALQNF